MFLVYEKLPCRPRRDTRGMQVPSSGTDEEEDRGTGCAFCIKVRTPDAHWLGTCFLGYEARYLILLSTHMITTEGHGAATVAPLCLSVFPEAGFFFCTFFKFIVHFCI